MTICLWAEYTYYDGLWAFHRGVVVGAGSVWWMGEKLPNAKGTGQW